MYPSAFLITSVWFNPISWSAMSRAHWFGLYPQFVHERLALRVPSDVGGVYLMFNVVVFSSKL